MAAVRRLVILGATGTVGVQALAILRQAASPLQVVALAAHSSADALGELAAGLGPRAAGAPPCRTYLSSEDQQRAALLEWLRGGDYDICLNAVVGAAGLPYSEAVLAAGCDLALANKESMVLAGGLLSALARQSEARILPVDSEHSAIHQCLAGNPLSAVRRLYLTASGGALRDWSPAQIAQAKPADALAHPNWDMGPRITIDSATMMNKALEILEACHLFQVEADAVQVLVHPQSVVHSMVEFLDGSLLAQLGPPDMAFPIHYALHWPERQPSPLQGFDAELFSQLTFRPPDLERFPALALGWRAAALGGAAGAVLNAADEVAVAAFLDDQLAFPEIAVLVGETLEAAAGMPADHLEQVFAADQWARERVRSVLPTPR